MKIIILHISDIHFRKNDTHLIERIPSIVNALKPLASDARYCVIAVSGDIAYSGKEEEYALANIFFSTLRSELESSERFRVPKIVLVPGNHDCNFDLDQSARNPILEHLASKISDLSEGSRLSNELLSVLGAFFSFQKELSPGESKYPWISQRITVPIEGLTLTFLCHNTALTSQYKEIQGGLRFPIGIAQDAGPENTQTGLILTIMHHPYNWFDAENSRDLKNHVNSNSDIVLTGHEHEEGAYTTVTFSGENISYIEGVT